MRLAVIDVGTLKVKFEIRDDKGKILYKNKTLTVLGRDLPKNDNHITERAIVDTIVALKDCLAKIHEYKVDRFRAVTTEAIRKAANADAVLSRIKKETGLVLETLSHDDEARIFFLHMAKHFPGKRIAVADVGGGSVQVIVGKDTTIERVYLFPTGTHFMEVTFPSSHLPSRQELSNAREYVRQEFAELATDPPAVDELIYGSSNIIDFMHTLHVSMQPSGYDPTHPHRAAREALWELYQQITELAYEDRMKLYPAEPYFMWGADMALINILELAKIFNVSSIVPTNQNLSSGLFKDLAVESEQ